MLRDELSRRSIIITLFSTFPFAAFAAQPSILDQAQRLITPPAGGAGAAAATGASAAPAGARLNQNEIGLGLKDALKVAAQRVVGRVGKNDGYNGDPAIRIPLPDQLQRVVGPLRSVGAGGMLDDLQLKMNRGAEQAAPKALNIFVDAATKMSFQDARMILTGPQDSATQYFRRTTSDSLTSAFRPIIDGALASVGAVVALNTVKTRASGIPLVGQQVANFNLTDFTVGKALDGCFHYLAVEEGAIRTNPIARSTDLLKRVFG